RERFTKSLVEIDFSSVADVVCRLLLELPLHLLHLFLVTLPFSIELRSLLKKSLVFVLIQDLSLIVQLLGAASLGLLQDVLDLPFCLFLGLLEHNDLALSRCSFRRSQSLPLLLT